MREIKFRAWDIGQGGHMRQWGDLQQINYNRNWDNKRGDVGWWNDPDFTLMQFTGLRDKNGKEIYEGDIVRFHYFYGSLGSGGGFCEEEHEITGVISWGTFGWGVSKIKGEHWRGYTGFQDGEGESSFMELMAMNESGVHEESFEVIGNIYENPELNKQPVGDVSK